MSVARRASIFAQVSTPRYPSTFDSPFGVAVTGIAGARELTTVAQRRFATTDVRPNDGGKAKVLVLFYSMYGHNFQMAKAAAEGAASGGAEVALKRVKETLPDEVLKKMHAFDAAKQWADVPIAEIGELKDHDALILVSPTRFGTICAQTKTFLDQAGGLWASNALVGKVGSAMTSSNTQHGGNEVTLFAMHTVMLHLGYVIVGLPYSYTGQNAGDQVVGGSPYGATTIANSDGSRQPSKLELDGAKFQGKHVATIAKKLR